MSQRGRGKRKAKDSDDEDEYDVSKSKKQKDSSIDKEELNKLVGDLMRYALFLDHNKTPLRREDISKTILKEHKRASKQVIAAARQKFRDLFGMDLIELPKKQTGASASKSNAGSGAYILKNIVANNQTKSLLHWSEQETAETSLLMIVLSMIWLNNGAIDQETLYDHLKRLGLREKEPHPVFDSWEKVLETKFTKEQYLDRKKGDQVGAEGTVLYEFRMGPRSMVEIDKKDILQFIALVHGEDRVDPALLKQLELEEEATRAEDIEEDEEETPAPSQSQQQQRSQPPPKTTAKKANGKAKPKKVVESDDENEESEEEEEEPLQRNNNKRKPSKEPESSSSSSSESSSEEEQTRRRPIRRRR